jgi:hypothetical protein
MPGASAAARSASSCAGPKCLAIPRARGDGRSAWPSQARVRAIATAGYGRPVTRIQVPRSSAQAAPARLVDSHQRAAVYCTA